MMRTCHLLFRIIVPALVLLCSFKNVGAATHNWSGAVNGLWSNASNWSSGGAPAVGEAAPVILNFPNSATRHNTTNDIGSLLFGYLKVDLINLTGNNYVIVGKGGGTNLYLSGYFSFPTVTENVYCTGVSNTFDSSLQLILQNNNNLYVNSGSTLTLQSRIIGTGGITFYGGTGIFNGYQGNTFTGTLNVQAGNVYFDNYGIYFDQYGNPYDVDTTALGGALIVGQTSNSIPANVYVQRGYQITGNSDITINPTGTLLFDRSVLNTNLEDYIFVRDYSDFNLMDNEARSLTLNGGTLYMGMGVYVEDFEWNTFTNTARLTVDNNLVSNLSPNPTTTSLVYGSGFLQLASCTSTIASDQLLMSAHAGGFKKAGPGTLTLFGSSVQGGLVIAQGSCNLISSNVEIYSLTVSNGAQMNITKPCRLGGALDVHGRGTNGNGAALNVQSPGVFFQLENLYVTNDTFISVVNPADQLTIQAYYVYSMVTGTNNLYKLGVGNLKFSDFQPNLYYAGFTNAADYLSNIFTGTLYVQGGTVELNSADPVDIYGVDAGIALNGPIVIGTNGSTITCSVQLDANQQLNTNVSITINDGCQLNIQGTNMQSIGALTLNGGTVAFGNVVLNGDVSAKFATYQPLLYTTVSLGGTNRTFNVATNSTLGVYGSISDGGNNAGIIKAGTGELDLYASNSYGGLTLVNSGLLALFGAGTPGSTNSGTVIADGAELDLKDGVKVGQEPLSISGIGNNNTGPLKGTGTNSWAGLITGPSGMVVDVATNGLTMLGGPISFTKGGLTKANTGILEFNGNSDNNYPGTTRVLSGALWLSKTKALAVPGPLVVGTGSGAANSVQAKLLQPGQLNPISGVTLNSDGFLDLNSVSSGVAGSVSGSGGLGVGIARFTVGLDNTSNTFSGPITGLGASALVKLGTGAWTLSGVSVYSGQTLVGSGSLLVDGFLGNSSFVVSNSATLGGNGTVGTISALGGSIISPGHSPGLLNSSSVTFNPGATFLVEISGTNVATGYDQLNVSGTVSEGNATLQILMNGVGATNYQYTIVNNDLADAVTGTFAGLPEGATVIANNGIRFSISYHGGSGNDVVLTELGLPLPPHLDGITKLVNGDSKLSGTGVPNLTYHVQANTNLLTTNWITLGTITTDSLGAMVFTDSQASSLATRFYRIVYP